MPTIKRVIKRNWKEYLTENASYKLVALCVTLILWVTILGRRDFSLTREIDIDFLVPSTLVLENNSVRKVEIQVVGPRMAIKKFSQRTGPVTVDLATARPGKNRVRIQKSQLDLPFGAKVVKITPEDFIVIVTQAPVAEAEVGDNADDREQEK